MWSLWSPHTHIYVRAKRAHRKRVGWLSQYKHRTHTHTNNQLSLSRLSLVKISICDGSEKIDCPFNPFFLRYYKKGTLLFLLFVFLQSFWLEIRSLQFSFHTNTHFIHTHIHYVCIHMRIRVQYFLTIYELQTI